jgi:hypothetical protein
MAQGTLATSPQTHLGFSPISCFRRRKGVKGGEWSSVGEGEGGAEHRVATDAPKPEQPRTRALGDI